VGALDGIRVVDFGQWIAGPMAGMLLADQGAEVIHLEPPAGPHWPAAANATLNRGKIHLTCDLKTDAGRAEARRLVASADVVLENFRPGVMDRLGVGAEATRRDNPGLIFCSLPGFASDDPRAAVPGWEGVVAAATATYPPQGSDRDGRVFTALPISSAYAAIAGAVAIVMALIARERGGPGQRIEVPLFDATFLAIGAAGLLVDGQPAGSRPDDPWGGVFRCNGGGSIRLSLATPAFVRRFVEAAGRRDWIERGYLEPQGLRRGSERRREQERALIDLFAAGSADGWEELGRAADVPLTKLRSAADWMTTEQASSSETVMRVDDPELGSMLQPGLAVRLSDTPGAVRPRLLAGEPWAARASAPAPVGLAAPSPPMAALDGIRVLDLTQVLAGPTAGRTLAEFGASVIKINNPREQGAGYRWSVHRYHTDVNRGKRSLLLDLKTASGRDLFWRLVARSDVVLQNFRPEAAERLGVDYAGVHARKPDVVYGVVSMFGSGGRWSGLPGYEVNAQAVSGMTARMDGVGQPFAVNDYATGLLAAFGIGLALFRRMRTGRGQAVEAALTRTATLLQAPYLQLYAGKTWNEPTGAEATGWGPLQRLYRGGVVGSSWEQRRLNCGGSPPCPASPGSTRSRVRISHAGSRSVSLRSQRRCGWTCSSRPARAPRRWRAPKP